MDAGGSWGVLIVACLLPPMPILWHIRFGLAPSPPTSAPPKSTSSINPIWMGGEWEHTRSKTVILKSLKKFKVGHLIWYRILHQILWDRSQRYHYILTNLLLPLKFWLFFTVWPFDDPNLCIWHTWAMNEWMSEGCFAQIEDQDDNFLQDSPLQIKILKHFKQHRNCEC